MEAMGKACKHVQVGHHRHASEMPFKWRLAGAPIVVPDSMPIFFSVETIWCQMLITLANNLDPDLDSEGLTQGWYS